jgi:hypothetical protein
MDRLEERMKLLEAELQSKMALIVRLRETRDDLLVGNKRLTEDKVQLRDALWKLVGEVHWFLTETALVADHKVDDRLIWNRLRTGLQRAEENLQVKA